MGYWERRWETLEIERKENFKFFIVNVFFYIVLTVARAIFVFKMKVLSLDTWN